MVKESNGTISFKEIEIYYKGIDERVWFLFNDIEKVLNKPELYEKEKLVLINKKRYISCIDLQEMLQKSNTAIAKELYTRLGFNRPRYVKSNFDEIENIKASFIDFCPILNYEVDPYRIQLYFPSLQIAVECEKSKDEYFNKEYEKERREYISSKLECIILSFNPHFEGFLLGDVIRQLRLVTNIQSIN